VVSERALLWLDALTASDRERAGAKAWALARMRAAGLPVPDGFVVPGDGPEPDARALEEGCRRLGAVAVRSSSVAEDSAEASFAGQFRTELDVLGADRVAEAVRRCRTGTAGGYAAALGVATGGTIIPVLVQQFVEPRQAGVVFTRDPRDPSVLVVESHPGRGEALVSGFVRPRREVLDRATGARRSATGGPDGALGEEELRAVVDLARRAEVLFGDAQDVEWAIGADGPVLLQSRPITVDSETALDPRIEQLTRANVGEVLPDPVTPLTASMLVAVLEHGFEEVLRRAGLGQTGAPPFLVIHHERLYLNLTRSLDVAARLPGVTVADAERLVLGAGAAAPAPRLLRVGDLRRLVTMLPRLLRLGGGLPARIVRAEEHVRVLHARTAAAERGDAEPAAVLGDFLALGREVAATHVAVSGASAVRLGILERLLGRGLPGEAMARVNRLLAGLDGVESAAPALELDTLAAAVRETPEWRDFLARPDAVGALARGDAPSDLAARIREFLHRYGHRALSEGELRARAWREDPAPVLQALATLAAGTRPAGFTQGAAAEQRQAEEQAILSKLGPVRRALLVRALAAAREGVRARERTKSLAVALVDEGRRLARLAGARLAAEGRLPAADDVFFLGVSELRAVLAGASPSAAALRRRRKRFEAAAHVPAPRRVDLRAGAVVAETEPSWQGTGVSAGIGVGRARVIAAGEPLTLEPGEVLVTTVLDAALGPLLASAAGAVAEIGGLLSHGAVVARELGVPCVVDIHEATRRLRTGERVLVDGSAGTVRPLAGTGEANMLEPVTIDVLPAASRADEAFHALEAHPQARESVYVNVQDPATGIVLVASVGARPGGAGEALVAVGLPRGRVLFALERDARQDTATSVTVGDIEAGWDPVRLRFEGRLSSHEAAGFPPGPVPLVLAPRTAVVRFDLRFEPTTPAVDFTHGLTAAERARLSPVGAHHVEQSGRWRGGIEIDGERWAVDGTGSRDHTWGRRDWEAAEWWRLFTARFGDDLAVHALAVSVGGHVVEGGFVWRDGRTEPVRRVAWTARRHAGALRSVELELGTPRGLLRIAGEVARTITVPVQLARGLGPHLTARPWRLLLHENFTRYTCEGRQGHGMAEFTERP
jgi:phosphohistidine swiveling domain-containing protein